jgi:GNAT superfamily N-acetyltransferase
MITRNYEEALAEYRRTFPHSPFFKTWVPLEKFVSCEFDSDGNISISREDGEIYGLALGASAVIPNAWSKFSIDSRSSRNIPDDCDVKAEWDCYWSPTIAGDQIAESQVSDEEIAEFLKIHAPESSVFPGDAEIQMWIDVVRDGQLLAIAAICRWESGELVISSVATHTDKRGQGIGKELMNKCLIAARQCGSELVCLGVRHENESAQRLYASTGFTLMHNFSFCERR